MRKSIVPRRFRHVPLVWWLAACVLAAVTGIATTSSVAKAQASAARYDDMVTVFIATRPLDAGTEMTADDVREEQRPSAFLPASPLLTDPIGRTVAQAVDEGEALTEAKVGTQGFGKAIALLQTGEQGVAIPTSATTPDVELGDPVDVLATFTTETAGAPTVRVVSGGRVVAKRDDAVTVAVTETEALAVAFANARGVVSIVLSQPGEGSTTS